MGRAIMDHRLINRIGGLVGENACRQTRHQLVDLEVLAGLHHIVIDNDVLTVELHLLRHVTEETPHQGRQVDDTGRLVLLEDGTGLRTVTEVTVLGGEEDVGLSLLRNGVCEREDM